MFWHDTCLLGSDGAVGSATNLSSPYSVCSITATFSNRCNFLTVYPGGGIWCLVVDVSPATGYCVKQAKLTWQERWERGRRRGEMERVKSGKQKRPSRLLITSSSGCQHLGPTRRATVDEERRNNKRWRVSLFSAQIPERVWKECTDKLKVITTPRRSIWSERLLLYVRTRRWSRIWQSTAAEYNQCTMRR